MGEGVAVGGGVGVDEGVEVGIGVAVGVGEGVEVGRVVGLTISVGAVVGEGVEPVGIFASHPSSNTKKKKKNLPFHIHFDDSFFDQGLIGNPHFVCLDFYCIKHIFGKTNRDSS